MIDPRFFKKELIPMQLDLYL
jgi:hypothetical protein